MTIQKKGSRKIIVDGNIFVWTIRKRPNHNERHDADYQIPIQHIDGGQLLRAHVGYCRSGYRSSKTPAITPAIIKKCISKALLANWDYTSNLPPMELDCMDIIHEHARKITLRFLASMESLTGENEEQNNSLKQIVAHIKNTEQYEDHLTTLQDTVVNLHKAGLKIDKALVQMAHNVFAIYDDGSYEKQIDSISRE